MKKTGPKLNRRLQTLFYSPSHPLGFTGNLENFVSNKKSIPPAKAYFEGQAAWTKHKPVVRRFPSNTGSQNSRKISAMCKAILLCGDEAQKLRRKVPGSVKCLAINVKQFALILR